MLRTGFDLVPCEAAGQYKPTFDDVHTFINCGTAKLRRHACPPYTQRVCGVCPVSHAMASSLALESAFEVVPTDNGRIMRNLVLGANFLQSHVLHFYHLAAPDYIDTRGTIVDMSPWRQHHVAPDMIDDPEIVGRLLNNYVQALGFPLRRLPSWPTFFRTASRRSHWASSGISSAFSSARKATF